MTPKKIDIKESHIETEFVKEENNPKRDYIFQNSGITKIGFWIIIAFLVIIVIGLIISGVFFDAPEKNP